RKGSERSTGNFDVSVGQFGYWRAAGDVSGSVGAVPLSLTVAHTDNGSPVEGSAYRGTHVGASISGDVSQYFSFDVTGRYGTNQADSFPDDSGGPRLAVIRDTDRRDIDEAVLGAQVTARSSTQWSQGLQYGLYDRASQETSPGVAPSSQDPAGIPPTFDE